MRSIYLAATAVLAYSLMSFYNMYDMDYYYGRWGYIRIEADGPNRMEIPSAQINVTLNMDNSIRNYGNGMAFVPATQHAAQQWNAATQSVPYVTNINIIIGSQNVPYYGYNQVDYTNSIVIDHEHFFIDKNNDALAARTVWTRRYGTLSNICEATGREIKEADIYLHDPVTNHVNWKVIPASTNDPHVGTQDPGYDYDYETTILHEMGHLLGLGHIVSNGGDYTSMIGHVSANTLIHELSQEDIQAIRDLYNRGLDASQSMNPNVGIIPCNKWYVGPLNGVNIKCRTTSGIAGDISSGGCEDVSPSEDGKDHMYCYNDDKGTTHAGFSCVFQDTRKRTPVNNFGISKPSVDNINAYVAQDRPYNYARSWRGIIIMTENETIAKDYLSKYTLYLTTGRKLTEESQQYASAFTAMDKVIDAFAPIVDATFRCADNEKNPDLFMNDERIVLLQNVNNELTRLNISDRLTNELNFISKTLSRTKGMNIKQAYEYIIAAKDPDLTLK